MAAAVQRPQHGIPKEYFAETTILDVAIDGQPADDHDRNWLRHVPSNVSGFALLGTRDKRVRSRFARGRT